MTRRRSRQHVMTMVQDEVLFERVGRKAHPSRGRVRAPASGGQHPSPVAPERTRKNVVSISGIACPVGLLKLQHATRGHMKLGSDAGSTGRRNDPIKKHHLINETVDSVRDMTPLACRHRHARHRHARHRHSRQALRHHHDDQHETGAVETRWRIMTARVCATEHPNDSHPDAPFQSTSIKQLSTSPSHTLV